MSRFRDVDIGSIPNEQNYDQRYLYVLHEEGAPGLIKVGRADNPIWRMSSLQAGNHRKLVLARAWVGRRPVITRVELEVHSLLRDRLLIREWFGATAKDVDAIMRGLNGPD